MVKTGQYRNDWDELFGRSADFYKSRVIAPSMGNHDDIDGLGADLYLGLFALPSNGAIRVERERNYSFRYGPALLLMLDATAVVEDQTAWLEDQLAHTDATWTFAVFHFPPYAPDDDYPDIRKEWCTLFDKYHVDLVMSGHVHYYLRTFPLRQGKRVASPADGTVYLVSFSVNERPHPGAHPDYAEKVDYSGTALYQAITVDGKKLTMQSIGLDGAVRDEFVIQK